MKLPGQIKKNKNHKRRTKNENKKIYNDNNPVNLMCGV
jgi:hypothetical protein